MTLASVLGLDLKPQQIVIVGKPEITNFLDSEGKPYYECQLKDPIRVTCSSDTLIEAFESDVVYVREAALTEEGWDFVNKDKPEEGFFRPGWVADFSKGQELVLYQDKTIKAWSKDQRNSRKDQRRTEINSKLREKIAQKAASAK